MLKVGITGGVGSGKSHIAKVFAELGIEIYDADFHAKELMENNPEVTEKITKLLGNEAYISGGLNRTYVADKIYSNNKLRQQVNAIVHPAVALHFVEWLQHAESKYIIKESAIMFEAKANEGLDYIISITAPVSLRMQRTLQRSGMTNEKFEAIVKNQIDDEERNSQADFILVNDEQQPLLEKIIELHSFLLSKCN